MSTLGIFALYVCFFFGFVLKTKKPENCRLLATCVSIFSFSACEVPLSSIFAVLSSSYAQSVSVLLSSPQFDGFSPQTRPCQCIQMTLFINNDSAWMPAYMRVSVLADQLLLSHDEEGQKFDFPPSLSFSQGLSLSLSLLLPAPAAYH